MLAQIDLARWMDSTKVSAVDAAGKPKVFDSNWTSSAVSDCPVPLRFCLGLRLGFRRRACRLPWFALHGAVVRQREVSSKKLKAPLSRHQLVVSLTKSCSYSK